MTLDKRERFTLRIPNDLYNRLQNEANTIGVSLNAFILQLLWEWSEKGGEPKCPS